MQTATDCPTTTAAAVDSPTTYDAAQVFLRDRPSRNLIAASWMPVYIEPITHSGERITAAVAIVTGTESPRVVNTLNAESLKGVFGRYGDQLINLADTITSDLQAWLITNGPLDTWQPHLSGVYPGRITDTRNISIDAIIRSAKMNTSLFSAKGNERIQDEPNSVHLNNFQAEIKRIVLASRKNMSDRFNRPFSLYGKQSKATISYVGTNLAVNFSALDATSNATYQCATAQRKIVQLLRLREVEIGHKYDELLLGVFVPARSLTATQEDHLDAYTTELEFAAKSAHVGFEVVYGSEGINESAMPFARRILADA